MRRGAQQGAAGSDHRAPARDIGVAEAEEGEGALDQDGDRDDAWSRARSPAQRVRQDVADHDRASPAPNACTRARSRAAAPGIRPARPARSASRRLPRPRRSSWSRKGRARDQRQRQHEAGHGLERLDHAHEELVDPAAIEAGKRADQMPVATASSAASTPIASEARAPCTTPASKSRPSRSVPSGTAHWQEAASADAPRCRADRRGRAAAPRAPVPRPVPHRAAGDRDGSRRSLRPRRGRGVSGHRHGLIAGRCADRAQA